MASWRRFSQSARSAYAIIKGGVGRSLSIARIGDIARANGYRISNEALSYAVKAERSAQEYASNLSRISKTARPNYGNFPKSIVSRSSKYSVGFRVRARDTSTGRFTARHVTVNTNRKLTRQQLEEAAMNAIDSNKEKYGLIAISATPTFAEQASDWDED